MLKYFEKLLMTNASSAKRPCTDPAGTPFARTRTPLQDWFYVMFLTCAGHKRMTAREVQRQIAVTYKTAWRIARAVKRGLGGEVPG